MKFKIICSSQARNSVAKKFISSILTMGLLFNSTLSSFAGTLSEDGRYETFKGTNIVINDVLEEEKVDIEIEGNTLVNLVNVDTSESKIISKNTYGALVLGNTNMFKNGEQYTIICEFSDIVGAASVCFNFNDAASGPDIMVEPKEGLLKYTFTMPEAPTIIPNRRVFAYYFSDNNSCKIKNLRVLEGDWTDKEIPEYFEGMKSVGQDDESSFKIEILSNNQNQFRKDLAENLHKNISWINENSFKTSINNQAWSGFNYKLNRQKKYWLTYRVNSSITEGEPNTSRVAWYDSNGVLQQWRRVNNTNERVGGIITDAERIHFGIISVPNTVNELEVLDIQISEIETDSYQPTQCNKKEILLNEPLRGLDNEVKDRIVKRNGQWVIERNCREIVLDGTENWSIGTESNGWTIYDDSLVVYTDSYVPKASSRYMCDKLPYISGSGVCTQNIVGTSNQTWSSSGHISIRIPYSYLETENLNGFKQWLSKNNLKIVYQLENPVYEPLNIDSTLNTYLDTTYVSNSSNIPANMKVTIDRTMNKAVEAIELAKLDPTTENLSDARYWVNLLRESVKKDELQSVITNIIGPTDIELERKTVSANTDVYVKSENMLSMSLGTNSISFDDYSGVEDMEMLDAVNITINSSLPYSLNAYMPNDITSNSSNQMNKDVLNIRDNSEGDYQNFDDSTNKLVLKDRCAEGNNKQHSIDLKLASGNAHTADVYRAVIKFEAEQK